MAIGIKQIGLIFGSIKLKQIGSIFGLIKSKQLDVPPPVLIASNASQGSGAYVVGDDILLTATVSDDIPFTGIDIYENGILQGSAVESSPGVWTFTDFDVTAGAKSYTARRLFSGGSVDNSPVLLTVLDSLAPNEITDATLTAWWRTPESLQWATIPLHTAGTGPANTLTGTLTEQILGMQYRITLAGVLGVAQYAISADNGNDGYTFQTGTTSASEPIGATGANIVFAAGSYVLTDVYKAVVNQLNDLTGNGNVIANLTSPQRPFPFADQINGFTAPRFDGVDDRLNCTTSLANDIGGGTNTPHTIVVFCRLPLTLPAAGFTQTVYRLGNTGNIQVASELRIKGGTTCFWEIIRRDSAGNVVIIESIIPATLGAHVLVLRFNGSEVNVRDNGVDVIGGDSGVDGTFSTPASITLNNLSLAAQVSSAGIISFLNGEVYDMGVYDGYIGDVEIVQQERYY